MTVGPALSGSNERRAFVLAAVILVQALTALFFLVDVITDFVEDGTLDDFHTWLELVATIALIGGVLYLMIELRQVMNRMATLDRSVRAARGEMSEVIDTFFTDWGLTASERDVALMVLKGIDNETIASLRGTAPGTVRAQCTSVYAKAGVDGRAQLFSVFMEELLADDG
ncbi:MAG: LuxR family transcriptional regulator [Maritimibacter sp.]|nr:LuxR family transcriptional regulator [Maritimibacter sp.]